MAYFIYILYSPSTDSFYKGQASDVNERLHRHNKMYEKATSHGAPWILISKTEKETRSEAIILERKLKNLSRQKLLLFIKKYGSEVEGLDALLHQKQ